MSKGDKLFNFHVIRWTKGRNVERLILQVSYLIDVTFEVTICCVKLTTFLFSLTYKPKLCHAYNMVPEQTKWILAKSRVITVK